jgi:hypothetical protein
MGFAGSAITAMTRSVRSLPLLLAIAVASPALAKGGVTPLFADSAPLAVTISGPVNAIVRAAQRSTDPQDATLVANGETHAIALSARGVSRRRDENCKFPPLSVLFKTKPADSSLFDGQKRMKLVTHCRPEARFDQYVLKEYAAYRLYNQLTDKSLKVRLARIRYEDAGKLVAERMGFFIEDVDDAASRLGKKKIESSGIPASALDREDTARYTLFQYLIGNLDWDMTHGPQANDCCHNSKILGPTLEARQGLTPVAYDFDYSGLVNAPYAVPPSNVPVALVTQRFYRGFCLHNEETRAMLPQFTAARGKLVAELAAIPGLDERTRSAMESYLDGFFSQVGTAAGAEKALFKVCRKSQ